MNSLNLLFVAIMGGVFIACLGITIKLVKRAFEYEDLNIAKPAIITIIFALIGAIIVLSCDNIIIIGVIVVLAFKFIPMIAN